MLNVYEKNIYTGTFGPPPATAVLNSQLDLNSVIAESNSDLMGKNF
jgi:hypothetical protein